MTTEEKTIPLFEDIKDVDTTVDLFKVLIQRAGSVSREIYQRSDTLLAQLKLLQVPVKAAYIGSPNGFGPSSSSVQFEEKGSFSLIFLEDGTVIFGIPSTYIKVPVEENVGIVFRGLTS